MKGRRRFSTASSSRLAVVSLVFGASFACAPPAAGPPSAREVRAIFGGVADTGHEAVMALLGRKSPTEYYGCSGTTVARIGTSAFLLTAAHCVVGQDAMEHILQPVMIQPPSILTVVPGPDYAASFSVAHTYSVAEVSVAPGYDGAVDSPHDVAVVRYLTYMPTVALIPIVEAADDKLGVGSALTLVGYGRTETDQMNSLRRTVDRPVERLTPEHIYYAQTDLKGQCQGDSGGPALIAASDGARVAGVISFGDTACTIEGASVRVSSVASFIHSVIAAATPPDAAVPMDATAAPDAMSARDAAPAPDAKPAVDSAPPSVCGKLTDPRAACAACIASHCCSEAAICAADPLCLGCGANPLPSCAAYPPSAILTACLATCPGDPCGVAAAIDPGPAPADGSSSDAGPRDAALDLDDRPVAGGSGGPGAEPARPDGEAPPPDGGVKVVRPPADAAAATDSKDARPIGDGAGNVLAPASSGCGCDVQGGPAATWRGVVLLVAILGLRRGRRLVRASPLPI